MPLPKRLTRERVKPKSDRMLKGSVLNYNVALQSKYAKALMQLVLSTAEKVQKEIVALFSTPEAKEFYAEQKEATDASLASQARIVTNALMEKYENFFALRSKKLALRMVQEQDKHSQRSLKSSLEKIGEGLSIKTNFKTNGMSEILSAAVSENVALIKSIGSQYLGNVQKAVLRSITTGNGLADLVPALRKYKEISKRHARNVALDQTRKVYNTMNAKRSQALGVKKFEWIHSGGGQKPRKDHIEMNGNVYEFDDLPIIDEVSGDRGIPGQAINCKCTMKPIIDFSFGGDE